MRIGISRGSPTECSALGDEGSCALCPTDSTPRLCSLLGVLLALGGCAVGPEYERPDVPVAEAWTPKDDPRIATQAAVDARWWESFGDPTLNRLVDFAYRQNLPLQIAGLRIAEARAQLAIATGNQYPQLQQAFASATAVGFSANSPFFAEDRDNRFVSYQVGFDALWELDLWGKYRRGVEAEAASMLASVGDYYSALVSLTAEVARTYAVIRTFEVLVDLAEENSRLQEESLRIAESRFRNGATSELDVTQATTLLESTRASVPRLRISLQQSRNALSTLLGRPPGALDELLQGPREIPRAPESVAVGMPAELLRRRPDVRSAELEAVAQSARIGVAKAELYPAFSLTGTIGLAATSGAGVDGDLGNGLFYSAGPQLVFPFFNYGRLENSVRVQDARFQQSLVAYQNVVLVAAQEVEDALAGYLNAHEAVALEEAAVASARRSVEIANSGYREGAVDYQRVLDAQRALLEQENNLADSRSAVTTNLIALYKALGGGWESRQDQPVLRKDTREEMEERTNWGGLLSEEPVEPERTEPAPPAER